MKRKMPDTLTQPQEHNQIEKKSYRVPEAAWRLSIGKAKLWQMLRDGRIASIKVDGCRLITAKAIDEFLERQAAESVQPALKKPQRPHRATR